MATTRIMPLHTGKGRTAGTAISDILDYVQNPEKMNNGRLITGHQCDTRTADAEFLLAGSCRIIASSAPENASHRVQKAKMLFFITMQNPFFVIPTLQSYELRKSGSNTVRAIFGIAGEQIHIVCRNPELGGKLSFYHVLFRDNLVQPIC